MSKFYSVGKSFLNLLKFKKFNLQPSRNSRIQYFVNPIGKQIRVTYSDKQIALLDKRGYLVEVSHSFTENQIDNFLKL